MSNRDRRGSGARRLLAVVGVGVALGALPGCSAELAGEFIRGIVVPARPRPFVLVVGLPMAEARAFVGERPSVVGLGVYPESRRSAAFLEQVWSGPVDPADGSRLGARSPVRQALAKAGRSVGVFVDPVMAGDPIAWLGETVAATEDPTRSKSVTEALRADFAVLVLPARREAERIVAREPGAATYVVGAGARTPVLVGHALRRADGSELNGVFAEGIARRRGIVTPYDLAATLLTSAGANSSGIGGSNLLVSASGRPLAVVDELGARLERDDDFGPGLSIAIVALGIASVVLGTASLIAGRRAIADAFVRAASLLPAGYVAGLFVPNGRWQVRAVPMCALFLLGLALPIRPARRFAGRALLATATGIAALAIVAAANPDGEVARSLWGNPLESWRFFGLRNHLAAFVTGGLLAASAALMTSVRLTLVAAIAAAIVIGAPSLGANFVGVLTLGFGAAIAVMGKQAGRILPRHLPIAAAAGVAAIAVALFADSGSPVSHGGRAVASVRDEGIERIWTLFRARARLNYAEVTDLGIVGFAGLALVAAGLGLLFWWAMRSEWGSSAARAGVGGAAAAGLAALLLEDSGFFTGAIIGFFAWIAFAAEQAETDPDRLRVPVSRSGSAPPAGDGRSGGA